MAKVTIKIDFVDTYNSNKSDKIAYVNPEATNETLTEFAKKLVALTTNTYRSTTKITEEAID